LRDQASSTKLCGVHKGRNAGGIHPPSPPSRVEEKNLPLPPPLLKELAVI